MAKTLFMTKTNNQSQTPVIILVEPQIGENIGMAARAMANFDLSEMRLVAPRQGWPNEMAEKAAAGAGHLIENAQVFDTLAEALGDLHYTFATTARQRDMVKPVFAPKSAVADMSRRFAREEKCGILFGREAVGLTSEDLSLADAIITAPVNPKFASLNLAQSVLLVGYEWFLTRDDGNLGRQTAFDGPVREGLALGGARLATRTELFDLFDHIEGELDDSGYFGPVEKRGGMVRNIRNMFHRMTATEQDVKTFRGIIAALSRQRRQRRGSS